MKHTRERTMTPKLLHKIDARHFRLCQRAVERYARRWQLAGDWKYPKAKRTEITL